MKIFTWVLRVLLALAFLAAGAPKFMNNPQMIEGFGKIGFGQWFRYFTGCMEVGGAILIVIPATGFVGAMMLFVTMCGATTAVLTRLGGNPAAPIVLGVCAAFVAYRLRPGASS